MNNNIDVINRKYEGLRELLSRCSEGAVLSIKRCFHTSVALHWPTTVNHLDDFHLVYVLSGNGRYLVNDESIDLFPGRSVLLGMGQWWQAFRDETRPPVVMSIRFDLRKGSKSLNEVGRELKIVTDFCGGLEADNVFLDCFDAYHDPDSKLHIASCHCVVYRALKRILIEHECGLDKPDAGGIKQTLLWIEKNPGKRTSIDALAAVAGMGRDNFYRLFRLKTGRSVMQYLVEARLRVATDLLTESPLSIKEIAAKLNYPDQYAFSKQYLKYCGQRPSAVRKQKGRVG